MDLPFSYRDVIHSRCNALKRDSRFVCVHSRVIQEAPEGRWDGVYERVSVFAS